MSLLLTWFDDKTAAVACDGRAVSWVYGGHVVPIFEDRHKFTVVAPNVVVAVVGSTLVSDHIYPLAADVAMQCDVHHLFECLEIMLPFHAQSFHRRRGPEHFVDYEQNPYHTSIVLVGFDEQHGRVRCVSWSSEDSYERGVEELPKHETFLCWGVEGSCPMAEKLYHNIDEPINTQSLEGIIKHVAERFPEKINSNVKSYLIRGTQ